MALDPHETNVSLIDSSIERHKFEGDDNLKRWMAALTVGNGAGLFGIFSLASKPNNLDILYLLLPSAWLFLGGVLFGSISAFSLIGGHRRNEEYWRLRHSEVLREDLKLPADEKLTAAILTADKEGDFFVMTGGIMAVLSGALFVIAIAIPLTRLTSRAFAGLL